MKPPLLQTLQGRIFLFFFMLLLATQIGNVLITSTLGVGIVNRQIAAELETAKRVFVQMFEQNSSLLSQGARVLAADFGFRDAVASTDLNTLASALENHGERIQADLMGFVNLQGESITYVQKRALALPGLDYPWLLDSERHNHPESVIKRIDGVLYHLITAPVATPLPVGWVVTGFRIDDGFAKKISNITNTEVSFVSQQDGGDWRTHASTLPRVTLDAIARTAKIEYLESHSVQNIRAKQIDYLSLSAELTSSPGQTTRVLLQKSRDTALAPFITLRDRLWLVGVLVLLLSVVISVFISRSVTRSIEALAGYARNIAKGDYSAKPVVSGQNEIADLAHAFDHMRTEISAREAHILDLAYRDTLTGLPNRAMFQDRLQQALHAARRDAQPLTMMLMDVDRFKLVNDTLGHHIGDLLLQEVAKRLRETLQRASDTVVRLGGDEFAILLPAVDVDSAAIIARALLTALEKPMLLEGQILDVRGSIGLASSPAHGEDIETLMRYADVAMYQAKHNGTGYAVYDVRYDQNTLGRLSLMSELRHAVENNHLTLYYQPKIDLKDGNHCAAEALVRWMHPERGLIPPNDFIPFAEQTGYIKWITRWVLNEGVRQCAEWARRGLHVDISINISARDLMNADLPDYFTELLRQHNCAAERICLEITESAIFDDPNNALENLQRLNAIGCQLSIDDYGTGYSSLAYLKRLPVSELKIDRSFVQNMVTDANDIVIVRSTIDLAHNLGLWVVAEGVETEATLKQLYLLGCDQAQGYFFSKPLSADKFYEWASSPGKRNVIKQLTGRKRQHKV